MWWLGFVGRGGDTAAATATLCVVGYAGLGCAGGAGCGITATARHPAVTRRWWWCCAVKCFQRIRRGATAATVRIGISVANIIGITMAGSISASNTSIETSITVTAAAAAAATTTTTADFI